MEVGVEGGGWWPKWAAESCVVVTRSTPPRFSSSPPPSIRHPTHLSGPPRLPSLSLSTNSSATSNQGPQPAKTTTIPAERSTATMASTSNEKLARWYGKEEEERRRRKAREQGTFAHLISLISLSPPSLFFSLFVLTRRSPFPLLLHPSYSTHHRTAK